MRKSEKNAVSLLELLVKARTANALDKTVGKSKAYQDALKQQDKAFDILDKSVLNKKQRSIVDDAISAANHCGAVYGAVAYRLGLHDGIKLIAELRKIT